MTAASTEPSLHKEAVVIEPTVKPEVKPTKPDLAERPSGYASSRLAIGVLTAIAMGIITQPFWPGSIIAAVAAVPLGFFLYVQARQGWTRTATFVALFTVLAWCGLALEPGPLNLLLFWLGCAAMEFTRSSSQATGAAEIALAVAQNVMVTPVTFVQDARAMSYIETKVPIKASWFTQLKLPAVALIIFGSLLAFANPLIGDWLLSIRIERTLDWLSVVVSPISLVTFAALWVALRARAHSSQAKHDERASSSEMPDWYSKHFTPSAIVLTLVLMNFLFAVENILDLSYIWQGIVLPADKSFKEYVHRGSYVLIVTSLVAAGLILIIFRRGSNAHHSPLVRWLVYLWLLQNVLLVASSAKRTVTYAWFEGHMTMWRISALLWMALIAIGLVLIALRILLKKENRWLLDCNVIAAACILLIAGLSDTRSYVSSWNAEWALDLAARNNDYTNYDIYFPYIKELAPASLPALERLVAAQNERGIDDTSSRSLSVKLERERQRQLLKSKQSYWQTYVLRYRWYSDAQAQ
jgi:hypothetical protein